MVFSIAMLVIVYEIGASSDRKKILHASELLIRVSIPLLIFEAYHRLMNPVFFVDFKALGREDLEFYYYKINSIMYEDSNFVGLYILALFCFSYFLAEQKSKSYRGEKIILIILCLLTLSRASIATILLTPVLYSLRHHIYKLRYTIMIMAPIVIVGIFALLNNYASLDDSFSSKFEIINLAYSQLKSAPYREILFGIGIGNSVNVIGIGPHNIIVLVLLETGAVGLILFTATWLSILIRTDYKASIVIFPIMTNGMSLAGHFIPYVYAMLAVFIVFSDRPKLT